MDIFESAMASIRSVVERKFNGNRSAAAKEFGVSVQSLHAWLNGERKPGLEKLSPILKHIGASIQMPDEKLDDFALIPKVAAKAGAGSSLETDGTVEGYYAFRHSFLDRVHIHGKHSVMMQVIGDSMYPLIHDGDTVLIDQSDKEARDGKIFVVGLGDELLVKRLQKTMRGWMLISQNPEYSPLPVEGPDLETFRIHGRVRWFGRILD